ncbi:putative siderophore-binding lipoprotein YfiY precursor [Aminobacter sp. MSH1]|uniref:ABC transporter substrate-binding protein n=1 Tax=Aminobacter sp. MSH1 TaxID=374606 RepID=UPI000D39E2A8|nr:iron-siderophore ABC transporter substrate-binding protein [Aminobacter sp. MSH1]AWC21534.1 putative siderophore-binding lipoprotein YfiY precursor [Aminobacter sp. MSH1]
MKLFVKAILGAALVAFGLNPAFAHEVKHAMGVTDVPENPQRIVVLTNEGTEAVLALGLKPVGAVRSWTGSPWYKHIAGKMDGVEVVGEESAINLELIAGLQPDLILGNKTRQEKIYDQLSAIAPTVMSERLRGDWKVNFALYADALGKKAEGDVQLKAFDDKASKLGEALGDKKAEKVSLIRFMPGLTRIYYKDTFPGMIFDQIGISRPAVQDKPGFADDVTKERIPEFDGDRLFYFVYETGNGKASKQSEEWLAEPLWQNLPVVKAGKAVAVDDAVWNTAGGAIAANLLLDDIARVYGVTPAQ